MGEAISDSDPLQTSQKSSVADLFVFDLLTDSRGVFSCIALSENKQGHIPCDSNLFEATVDVVVELVQSIIEVSRHFIHIFNIRARMIGVGITKASADGLINKNNIVLVYPGKIILDDLIWSHAFVGWDDKVRT